MRIAAIGFEPPEVLRRYRDRLGLEVELYTDPERATYAAFGFARGSVARVWLDPRVWARYADLLRRGRRIERIGSDTLQLGGDVVVAADGRVRWIHRSTGPGDRPSFAAVRAACEDARR